MLPARKSAQAFFLKKKRDTTDTTCNTEVLAIVAIYMRQMWFKFTIFSKRGDLHLSLHLGLIKRTGKKIIKALGKIFL